MAGSSGEDARCYRDAADRDQDRYRILPRGVPHEAGSGRTTAIADYRPRIRPVARAICAYRYWIARRRPGNHDMALVKVDRCRERDRDNAEGGSEPHTADSMPGNVVVWRAGRWRELRS